MALQEALAKLTVEDKKAILAEVIILPTIEVDKSLSKEEYGDILLAGKKLGFSEEEIKAEIDVQVKKVGAVIEE